MLHGFAATILLSFFSLMITITSANGFYNSDVYSSDAYRAEVRTLAVKNHKKLKDYSKARRDVMQKLHLNEDGQGYFVRDVYCHIKFREKVGPSSMPKHTIVNIEHTWPQSRFGVRKGSTRHNTMKSDLHHLFPTETNSNSTRSSHVFGDLKGAGEDISRKCKASQVGYRRGSGRAFEPPHEHKGNVARALFYMAVRYDLKISKGEEFFLRQWHLIDPVDAKEMERNDGVEKIQGNRNPFVDEPDLVNLITNF